MTHWGFTQRDSERLGEKRFAKIESAMGSRTFVDLATTLFLARVVTIAEMVKAGLLSETTRVTMYEQAVDWYISVTPTEVAAPTNTAAATTDLDVSVPKRFEVRADGQTVEKFSDPCLADTQQAKHE